MCAMTDFFFAVVFVGIDFIFDVDNSSAYTPKLLTPFEAKYHVFCFSVLMFGTSNGILGYKIETEQRNEAE